MISIAKLDKLCYNIKYILYKIIYQMLIDKTYQKKQMIYIF